MYDGGRPGEPARMPHADFVHLRVRGLLAAAEHRAVEALATACASGDAGGGGDRRCNLFGAMQFCAAAKRPGVQPIVGMLLALAPLEACRARRPAPAGAGARRAPGQGRAGYATCCA